jgi:hypothetical protein
LIIQLVNKAASGHLASMKLLMPFFVSFAETASEEEREAMAVAPLERIKARLALLSERKKEADLLLGGDRTYRKRSR